MFLASVIIAQGVYDHFLQDTNKPFDEDQTSRLLLKFDSLPRVCLSMLESVTGGDDWSNAYVPLENVGGGYPLVFLLYICFMVDIAISKTHSDKELAVQGEMMRRDEIMKNLIQVFKKIDDDASGTIDYFEWECFAAKSESQAFFSLLGIDIGRTQDVFKSLDWDNSGAIEMDDFVVGCMGLLGGANVVDKDTLHCSNKKLFGRLTAELVAVERRMQANMTELKIYLLRSLQNTTKRPEDDEKDPELDLGL